MSLKQNDIFIDNLKEQLEVYLEDYGMKLEDVKTDEWGNKYIELPEEFYHRNSDGNFETDDVKYHYHYLPEKFNF